ncbi:MAG: hypothetical protein ACNI27_07010 [Desulfovibrio sp.]
MTNDGFTEPDGPISKKLFKQTMSLKAMAQKMAQDDFEAMNSELNKMLPEIERVAALEQVVIPAKG